MYIVTLSCVGLHAKDMTVGTHTVMAKITFCDGYHPD